MPVNSEGEVVAPPVPAVVHERMITEAAESIVKLQGEVTALVNAITALVIVTGEGIELGFERQLVPADMDRIGGHFFTMTQDPETKVITLRARKKDGASLALTARQLEENRRAGEVALPKSGLIAPPSKLIIP